MDSNVVDFTSAERLTTEDEETRRRHAEAFRYLEGRISDCFIMSWLAFQQTSEAIHIPREVAFAVTHSYMMLKELQNDYHAALIGERRMPL